MEVPPSDREISGKMSEDYLEKSKVSAPDYNRKEAQKQEEEENENEDDFSFACTNPEGSPVDAEAIFQDGQIRPTFPIFDQSLLYGDDEEDGKSSSSSSVRPHLRKLFIEERSKPEEEPSGPYCEWKSSSKTVKEVSPERCKKSNSTGFSKIWKLRDLIQRSSSDGKDAFVFLNNHNSENIEKQEKPSTTSSKTTTDKTSKNEKSEKPSKGEKVEKAKTTGEKKVKADTVSSAYERHYVKSREMREGDKRKTYSPYRQEVFGFFTNVNGMSRNVHPF